MIGSNVIHQGAGELYQGLVHGGKWGDTKREIMNMHWFDPNLTYEMKGEGKIGEREFPEDDSFCTQ